MDGKRFDSITRAVASRRTVAGLLAGLGAQALSLGDADAKKMKWIVRSRPSG